MWRAQAGSCGAVGPTGARRSGHNRPRRDPRRPVHSKPLRTGIAVSRRGSWPTRPPPLSRRGRWIRNGPMWPNGWPKWPGGNTPPAPRRPSRPEGNHMEERLRQYVWLGWGVAGLRGFGVGWLVGWGGGAVTASHRPRLLGTRARRASGNSAGAPGCQGREAHRQGRPATSGHHRHRPRADPRFPACLQRAALIQCVASQWPSGRITDHRIGFREVSMEHPASTPVVERPASPIMSAPVATL